MKRRNFLYNSGILASAIAMSPSSAWAADVRNKAAVLIIQDASAGNSDMINTVIRDSSRQTIHELMEGELRGLVYSSKGFLVTMNDGKVYLAEKIIFSSHKKIDVSQFSAEVKTENKNIRLRYDAIYTNTDPAPEFWAFSATKFDNGKINAFIKRNKHAFLCIS